MASIWENRWCYSKCPDIKTFLHLLYGTFFYLYYLLSLVLSYFICVTFFHLYVTNLGVGQNLGEPDIKTYLHLYYLLLPLLSSFICITFLQLYVTN